MPKTLTAFDQSDRAEGDYFQGLILQNLAKNVWVPGDEPSPATDTATAYAGTDLELANFQDGTDPIAPSSVVLGVDPHNRLTGYDASVVSGIAFNFNLSQGTHEIKLWAKLTQGSRVNLTFFAANNIWNSIWDIDAATFSPSAIANSGNNQIEETQMENLGEAGTLAHLKLDLPASTQVRFGAYQPDIGNGVSAWAGAIAYEIIPPPSEVKIPDLVNTTKRNTDARISIPYAAFIDSITFALGDRRGYREFDVTFNDLSQLDSSGTIDSSIGSWSQTQTGQWILLQRTHNPGDGSTYAWDIYCRNDAGYLVLSIQDDHSGRRNNFGAVYGYTVKYKPYPGIAERELTLVDPNLVTPEPIPEPFTYSWSSFGGAGWSAPGSFTPERDMIVKAAWTGGGWRESDGHMGWTATIDGAELVGKTPMLRTYINPNNRSQHIPLSAATGYYRCTRDQLCIPRYTPLADTKSDGGDYFSISIEEVSFPVKTINQIDPSLITPTEEIRYVTLISQAPIDGVFTDPANTFHNTASAATIGGSFQTGDRITLFCDIGTLVTVRTNSASGETLHHGRDQRPQSTNVRTGIRLSNGFIQHRGVDNVNGSILWVTVERRVNAYSVATRDNDPITHVYEFTLGGEENTSDNYRIPNWAEMTGQGYAVGSSNLILDSTGGSAWIVPGFYIGSNHASFGVRYTLDSGGSLGTWQKGTEARGKKARLSVTWVKNEKIFS